MGAGVYCGHGKSIDGAFDTGCTYKYKGRLFTEAELMAKVTASCVYYLREAGVTVVTDMPGNNINMVKQVEASNRERVKIHVAFHCDYEKAPAGTLPLYTSSEGRKLAAKMNKYVLQYSSLKTRGLARRTDLYELNTTNMPAVIFEVGSIKKDLRTMRFEYDAIGFGAARGICEYMGVKFLPKQMRLLNELTKLEKKVLSNHFGYSGKATYTTFQKALKGSKKINCALFITWGLQAIKVLPTNRRIWLGNDVNGSGAKTLRNKCKVYHPDKLPKDTYFHIGDIVGFQWGSSKANKVHTMAVRGFVNGRVKWATCGSSDLKAKDLSRCRSTYDKKKVKTICRLK